MPDPDSSNDLPMSANLQDIAVKHYVLDLACHMGMQMFEGSIILLSQPAANGNKITNRKSSQDSSTSLVDCAEVESTKEHNGNQGKREMIPQYQNLTGIPSKVQTNLECKPVQKGGEFISKPIDDSVNIGENCVQHVEAVTTDCQIISTVVQNNSECKPVQETGEVISKPVDGSVENCVQHVGAVATDCFSPEEGKLCLELSENPPSLPPAFHMKSTDKSPLCHLPPLNPASQCQPFKMILDSYKLNVQEVEGMFLEHEELMLLKDNPDKFVKQIRANEFTSPRTRQWHQMEFVVKEHCIHVFMEAACTVNQFPHAVRIWYSTHPDGPSLKWTSDQDGNPCVFTIGHFLNNRALFPSQDVPSALPTWHANITVDSHLTVLLTGDKQPEVTATEDGKKLFSYFTAFPMPSSTFGIAVGSWTMETLTYEHCDRRPDGEELSRPTVRLFFPDHLKEKTILVLGSYLPCCLLEVQRILGIYPLHQLDVLIVPSCFDSLGMASPSLLFLSQSLLCPDGSLCMRVAHEICHTWFGIVIGPLDWTEEWMTEGFCTYLEDLVHAKVCQLGDKTEDSIQLRSQLHLRVLKAELQNTDESLQNLRPNKGAVDETQSTTEETRFLKNGMNVDKKFMQVHYLKGYFLLQMLEQEVGRIRFLSFLRCYVQRYIYQLVSSQDFLHMFFETFPELIHLSVDTINRLWLDCPGMPESLSESERIFSSNILSAQVNEQLSLITQTCRCWKKRKRRRGSQSQRGLPALAQLQALQVVLLLDGLLDEDYVPGPVLDLVKKVHHAHLDNAEVAHRWCELVVKHKHSKCSLDLEHFLTNHQAMGVYLYGEAMISESQALIELARTCFRRLQHDMPESVRRTVSGMLFAS